MSTTEIITPQSRSRGMSYSILTQFERKLFLNCVFNEEVGVQKKWIYHERNRLASFSVWLAAS